MTAVPARAFTSCNRRQRAAVVLRATDAPRDVAFGERYPSWEFIFKELTVAGIKSLSPEDAQALIQDGAAVLVDVRPKDQHNKSRPEGAVSAPAYRIIKLGEGNPLKWLACKANGVTPVEVNPQFLDDLKKACGSGGKAIFMCDSGGTLQPSTNFAQGKPSRSLKAAWKAIATDTLPVDRVYHLDGGVYGWFNAGLPMIGEYDVSQAARTPNVAEKPTGVYIDGRK